ncbi:low temperature requirement protein A [Streptomyces sp. NPDC000410]|uniref:low temperature requirement protein A n=1 Tax=Streptomyces sp. NPDC000410 TaxID=3154254 RepID=UPI00332EC301
MRLTTHRPLLRTEAASGAVTPTELFFDLVFVFVVTQVTHQVEAHPGWQGLAQGLLPLAAVWWMFGSFGWLTNAVRPDAPAVRLLLGLAMTAFFLMGLALPYAFEPDGIAFPLAFLAAVVIHAALFLTASEPSARRGILRYAPFNAVAGLLILLAPHLPARWTWAAWVAAIGTLYLSTIVGRVRGFVIEPHHFVERHGLITLIVVGESIVAVGIGAQGRPVDAPLALAVTLGIAIASGIWWIYFNGDEERSVEALAAAEQERRQMLGYQAFGLAHAAMIAGIVLIAAGISHAIHHFAHHTQTWWLGAGTAVFLAGHAAHRRVLGTGTIASRLVGAVVAVPLCAVAAFAGWAALTASALVLVAVATLDHLALARGELAPTD